MKTPQLVFFTSKFVQNRQVSYNLLMSVLIMKCNIQAKIKITGRQQDDFSDLLKKNLLAGTQSVNRHSGRQAPAGQIDVQKTKAAYKEQTDTWTDWQHIGGIKLLYVGYYLVDRGKWEGNDRIRSAGLIRESKNR